MRTLFAEGKKKKEIARFLRIDVKTVRRILDRAPESEHTRSDKIQLDSDLLKHLHAECDGYVQRMHEILTEEHQIPIGYSTLTRLLREHGIGERDLQIVSQIRSPSDRASTRTATPGAPSEEAVKYAREISKNIFKFPEDRRKVVRNATQSFQSGKTELIVGLAFLIISQDLVCFGRFLELLFGLFIALVTVWMVFDGKTAVGFFYIVFRCLLRNAQYFVVISLCQFYSLVGGSSFLLFLVILVHDFIIDILDVFFRVVLCFRRC